MQKPRIGSPRDLARACLRADQEAPVRGSAATRRDGHLAIRGRRLPPHGSPRDVPRITPQPGMTRRAGTPARGCRELPVFAGNSGISPGISYWQVFRGRARSPRLLKLPTWALGSSPRRRGSRSRPLTTACAGANVAIVRFRDLGPLLIEIGGVDRTAGGRKPGIILSRLLANVNERVPADALVDALSSDGGRVAHAGTMESHIWRLRKILEPGRRPHQAPAVLPACRAELAPRTAHRRRHGRRPRQAGPGSVRPGMALGRATVER